MKILFPLHVDPEDKRVVRDDDGQFVLEAADASMALLAVLSLNYTAALPDPKNEGPMELN